MVAGATIARPAGLPDLLPAAPLPKPFQASNTPLISPQIQAAPGRRLLGSGAATSGNRSTNNSLSSQFVEEWRSDVSRVLPEVVAEASTYCVSEQEPIEKSPVVGRPKFSEALSTGSAGDSKPSTPEDVKPEWGGTSDENARKALEPFGEERYWQVVREEKADHLRQLDPILAYQLEQQELREESAHKALIKRQLTRHRKSTQSRSE